MNRYKVDFIINDKIVGHCYSNGWTRSDAWHWSWNSEEYKIAQQLAKQKSSQLMWDATMVFEDSLEPALWSKPE